MTDSPDFSEVLSEQTPPSLHEHIKRSRTHAVFVWLEGILARFSPSERLALYALSAMLAVSVFLLLAILNRSVSIEVPAPGGSLTEGEVGPARFINPILMVSQPDQDISALVYSGLVRTMPDGGIIPDLARSYEISRDGTVYTFHLRRGLTFQDGTPLTAADILFTVALAQNPQINSPQRGNWEGVRAASPDSYTVIFTLPQAYAPFIENATLGILPRHLWQDTSPEEIPFSPINTHPIGSGPYKIKSFTSDDTGSAITYDLVPFEHFTLGKAYLSHIKFIFFHDDDAMTKAFNARQVDAIAGVDPSTLADLKRADTRYLVAPLPRVFGVFFNQSHNHALTDAAVRAALDAAVDKDAVVGSVLKGYGVALDGPVPPIARGDQAQGVSVRGASDADASAQRARTTLKNGGWVFNAATGVWTKNKQPLSIVLSTGDMLELVATANAVARSWRAAGILVRVAIYPLSDLNTTVIRPRNYDAVLFGEVVGRELDLYAFWGSKERNDPGLNLALYANAQADALLKKARTTTSPDDRATLYAQFSDIVQKDRPAVFLYAPDFVYVTPVRVQGITLGSLTSASERFANVYRWYVNTQHVWNVFNKTN